MEKVKRLVDAGASLSGAVREALGEKSIAQLALEQGVPRSNLTAGLNGRRWLTDREVDALVAGCGGTREEMLDLNT